jgi:hypothetical protein
MRTLKQPSSPEGGNAATGLVFVGVVLAVLFAAGIAAVMSARPGQPAATPAQSPGAGAPGRGGPAGGEQLDARREAGAGLVVLVRLRDLALLARVYTPNCANRRYDQAVINQLRSGRQRWLGLRSSVEVLDATPTGERRWTLVAAVSRAPARLVTEDGRQVRAVPAQRQVLRFTMLRLPDRRGWALLGIASGG